MTPSPHPTSSHSASFHSEQGQRADQEDRCVLVPNVNASSIKQLESYRLKHSDSGKFAPSVLEILKAFSIACVFDGHRYIRFDVNTYR